MTRKTARDTLADKKCDPFADEIDRYLRDKELVDMLRAALESGEYVEGLKTGHWSSTNPGGMTNRETLIIEVADLEKSLSARAQWLTKRQHPELKAMELSGPDGGAFVIKSSGADIDL